MKKTTTCLLAAAAASAAAAPASGRSFHLPGTAAEQIHMAAGSDVTERVVSFSTQAPVNASCRYGNEEAYMDMYPATKTFEYNAFESAHLNRTLQMHSCKLGALHTDASGSTYYYQVGTQTGDGEVQWSDTHSFYVFPDVDFPVDFAVFGDLGNKNHQIVPLLEQDLAEGAYHAVLHVGDLGYNMDEEMGGNGDFYKRMMQPVASSVPYMAVPGNHENDGRDYSQFTNRFEGISQLSDSGSNWYYSWEVSNAKVVMFNSELWYDTDEGLVESFWAQYSYLNETLMNTDRSKTPWLIAAAHRPLYCSNVDDIPDCTSDAAVIRDGFVAEDGTEFPGVEDLFQAAGVDLFLTAHEHSYERTWPVYNGQVDSQQQSNHSYVDAKAPVHIVTGAGGCREGYDYYDDVFYGPWSVLRSSSYGFGHLRVVNETSLHWSQYLSLGDAGTDELWMHKTEPAAAPQFWPVPEGKSPCSHYTYAVCAASGEGRDCVAESACQKEAALGQQLGAGVEARRSRIPDRS